MLTMKDGARVLAIGAHPDDIELGAGGFVCRLKRQFGAEVHFLILTPGLHSPPGKTDPYCADIRVDEAKSAADKLGVNQEFVHVLGFDDCGLQKREHEVIRAIEVPINNGRYDLILTHCGEDTHSDHRVVHEATLSAARDFHGTVLLYQAPSTKPNGFHPTFFVEMDDLALEAKRAALERHASQRDKEILSPARTRGLAETWARFHRMPEGVRLEAFEVYKAFL